MLTIDPYTDELPPLVEAILKESMRKYPTTAVLSMREISDDNGFDIPNPKNEKETINLRKGTW